MEVKDLYQLEDKHRLYQEEAFLPSQREESLLEVSPIPLLLTKASKHLLVLPHNSHKDSLHLKGPLGLMGSQEQAFSSQQN